MSLGDAGSETAAGGFYALATRALVAAFVLAIFAGLGILVYVQRLNGGSLVFFAGVIVGYLAHVAASAR